MNIRPAHSHDAQAIASVQVNAWRHGYRDLMPQQYLANLCVDEKSRGWQRTLSKTDLGSYRVIETDGVVAGFCVYGPARDADLSQQRVGELVALNVDPSYWRRGLATALVSHVFDDACSRSWQGLYLWVLEKNPARRFYHQQGFVADGEQRMQSLVPSVALTELRYCRRL